MEAPPSDPAGAAPEAPDEPPAPPVEKRDVVEAHLRVAGRQLTRVFLVAIVVGLTWAVATAVAGSATNAPIAEPLALLVVATGLLATWIARDRDRWAWICAAAAGLPAGVAVALPWLAGRSLDNAISLSATITSGATGLVVVFVIVSLGLGLLPRRLSRRVSACPNSYRGVTILVMTAACLVVTLESDWLTHATQRSWRGQSRGPVLLAGRLPFSDAAGWHGGSLRVAHGKQVRWAARRPVHTLMRAGMLRATGDSHQLSLVPQAALCALAITALSLVVWRILGIASVIPVWLGLVTVATGFVTTYLTECVGLSVACLALAYLLRGSHDQNVPSRMLGYGILGLGWLIRPGPMGLLALPAVLEWTLRGPRRAARGLLAVALVLGALVAGKAAFALVATPNATENANAALTIYGLALGEAWNVAEAKFYADDATRRTLDTSERVTLQYKLAKAAFLNDPKPALAKCAQNLVEGTRALTVHLPAQLWLQRKQSTQLSHDCAFLLLLPGSIVALGFLFRRSRSVSLLLGGACLAGLASLPLIWADGTWRGVVLVLPFMIVFHSLAFSLRHLRAAPSNSEGSPPDCPEAISLYAATAATSLLLSLGVLAFVFPNADVQPVINVERDACVFLGETSSAPRLLGAPVIATAEAADSIRAAGMDLYDLDAVIEGIKTPALLCARPTGGSPSWLIVEGATPRTVGRLAVDTMAPHENRYFSVATHWHWLDPQE